VFSGHVPAFSYVDNSWNWGSGNVTYAQSPHQERQRQGIDWVLAFFGLAAAGAGVFYAGKTHGNWMEAWDKFDERHQIHKASADSQKWSQEIGDTVHLRFLDLIKVQSKIDSIQYTDVAHRFYAMIGIATGGASIGFGALMATPWLVTAGSVAAFAATLLGIWTIASHWDDQQKLEILYQAVIDRAPFVTAALNPLLHPITALSTPPVDTDNKTASTT
jgi:hypothetical protein